MKKEKLKIYLFRHGQTTYNRDKIFTGHIDSRLTNLGIEQAKNVGNKLKNKKFQLAIKSSLSRSRDTLKEVLKYHPNCKVITDDRIIERDYGNLSGKTHNSIIKKFGENKFNDWHRSWDIRPPKGEAFIDVEKRVKPFISDLIKMMKKENISVAISAHGNSIRLFRKIMEKLSIKETCNLTIPYEKIYKYEVKK